MNPETVVYTLLAADEGFTAIAGDRLFDTRGPAGTKLPYVTFLLVDDPDDRHLTGRASVRRARVQVDCWGDTTKVARDLANAVDAALSVLRRTTIAELDVFQITRIDTRSGDDGEATRIFRRSADYQVTYNQE